MSVTEDENDSDSPPAMREPGETQIFLCDPSAEAGRLLNALQSKGFNTVDVPLGLLPNRTRYEVPRLVVCDADAHEAHKRLVEMQESCADKIMILLLGFREGALSKNKQLAALATATAFRPLDIAMTTRKIADLVGPPSKKRSHRPRLARANRAPSLVTAARKPYRSDTGRGELHSSRLPSIVGAAESKFFEPGSPRSSRTEPPHGRETRASFASNFPKVVSATANLSSETAAVLEEGRRRVESYPEQAPRPIRLPLMLGTNESTVREDFLAALAEPLDDSEHAELAPKTGPPSALFGTLAGTRETRIVTESPESDPGVPVTFESHPEEERTNPGGRPMSQPPTSALPTRTEAASPPPLDDLSDLLTASDRPLAADPILGATRPPPRLQRRPSPPRHPPSHEALLSSLPAPSLGWDDPPSSLMPATVHHGTRSIAADRAALSSPESVDPPTVDLHLGAAGAQTLRGTRAEGTRAHLGQISPPVLVRLARAIADRATGAVAQEETSGIRRITLADGDIATVTSSIETEDLAHFLFQRGDLSEEVLLDLGSIPHFGRHAGAALIARGLLQQEDLWPVLRAHAEWILAEALRSRTASHFETTVPARLQEEPAVFGGAAGTEIYVDAIRRVVSPEQAFVALGRGERLLGIGPKEALLRESALTSEEQSQLLEVIGKTIPSPATDKGRLLPIVYALLQLGVFCAGGGVAEQPLEVLHQRSQEMDDEAFGKRLLARRALVDDGDYFGILGVSRSATRHEVDRAHDQLLLEYDEERLTPRILYLKDDLRLVLSTIREAHLVLSDDVRRLRYRLALEATPN